MTAQKAAPIRKIGIDERDDQWGLTPIAAETVEQEAQENPMIALMQHVVTTPALHRTWQRLPLLGGRMSKSTAIANAKVWRRPRIVGDTKVQFDSRAFHAPDGTWIVGIYYDPDSQPTPRTRHAATTETTEPEPVEENRTSVQETPQETPQETTAAEPMADTTEVPVVSNPSTTDPDPDDTARRYGLTQSTFDYDA